MAYPSAAADVSSALSRMGLAAVEHTAVVVVATMPAHHLLAHHPLVHITGRTAAVLLVALGGHEDHQAPITVHTMDHHTTTTVPALARLLVTI